jgi:hypothetical protein
VSHAALFPVAGLHLVSDVIQSFSRAASVVVWPLGKIQLFAALVELADKPPGHGGRHGCTTAKLRLKKLIKTIKYLDNGTAGCIMGANQSEK